MSFKVLDPEMARKAIEGYTDVLEDERKKADAFYRQFVCPKCGAACNKKLANLTHAFGDPDSLLPRYILECSACSRTFDPHTGITLKTGNVFQVKRDIPIVGGGK